MIHSDYADENDSKSQPEGQQFEEEIADVQRALLAIEGTDVKVERNFGITGYSGTHNVDIYYEFWHANVKHKVAISASATLQRSTRHKSGGWHSSRAMCPPISESVRALVAGTSGASNAIVLAAKCGIAFPRNIGPKK